MIAPKHLPADPRPNVTVHIHCRDYEAHRFRHVLEGTRWRCPVCEPQPAPRKEQRMPLTTDGRPILGPRHSLERLAAMAGDVDQLLELALGVDPARTPGAPEITDDMKAALAALANAAAEVTATAERELEAFASDAGQVPWWARPLRNPRRSR